MKALRPATNEEVERIRENSNLDPTCKIVALDTPKGPILCVIRQATELDPVHMPEGCNAHHFAAMLRDCSNCLLGMGAQNFYFNLHADDADADYGKFMEDWGAIRLSKKPSIRYRKNLYELPATPAPQD